MFKPLLKLFLFINLFVIASFTHLAWNPIHPAETLQFQTWYLVPLLPFVLLLLYNRKFIFHLPSYVKFFPIFRYFNSLIFILSLLALLFTVYQYNRRDAFSSTKWTMINVNTTGQADAHLLQFSDGQTYMIDIGGNPLAFLRYQNVQTIDKLFISHLHRDHYDGIYPLMKSDIHLKEVYLNVPNRAVCDAELPWGCNHVHIQATIALLQKHGVIVKPASPGDVYYQKDDVRLELLYAYDGINSPVGKTDVNDTSLIMLLTHGSIRALFTGDLNERLGEYLAKEGANLEADILKVPHHGTEGIVPNVFFDRVHPKAALIPGPKTLWLSQRSKRIKDYFENKAIDTYVNGIHGHVKVQLHKNTFTISTEQSY